jgi:hypothetical protein
MEPIPTRDDCKVHTPDLLFAQQLQDSTVLNQSYDEHAKAFTKVDRLLVRMLLNAGHCLDH